jgi:hypothetical protein
MEGTMEVTGTTHMGATAAVIGTAAITTVTITTAAITPTTRPSSEDSRFQFRSPSQVSKHFAVNE